MSATTWNAGHAQWLKDLSGNLAGMMNGGQFTRFVEHLMVSKNCYIDT